MQLPPLSSSYTIIPEKSFHLCHTYTLKHINTYPEYAQTANHINTHKLSARCPCQHSMTTQKSYRFQICSSTQLTVQSLSVPPQIIVSSFCKVSSFSPWFLQSYISYSQPPAGRENREKLSVVDCEFCYPSSST